MAEPDPIIVEYRGRDIFVGGSKAFTSDLPIRNVAAMEDRLIVLLEVDPKLCFNQNVLAIDASGRELWTIQERKWPNENSPYVMLLVTDDDLWAINWSGYTVRVSLESGRILETVFTK